jgi:hypothetical protein
VLGTTGDYVEAGWVEYQCGGGHCAEVYVLGYYLGNQRCFVTPVGISFGSDREYRTFSDPAVTNRWHFEWNRLIGAGWEDLGYCLSTMDRGQAYGLDVRTAGNGTGLSSIHTELKFAGSGRVFHPWAQVVCDLDTTNWYIDPRTSDSYHVLKGAGGC